MEALKDKFDFQSNFLYAGLVVEEVAKIERVCELIHFAKGSSLFYEKGVPTGVFFIESGRAKKHKRVLDKQEQIFYIYTSGDLLGYHAILSQERYQDSCQALEDMVVKFISKENFILLLEEIPSLKNSIIKNMAHEFGVMANTISVLANKSLNARLAIYLLILETRFNKTNDVSQGINISRSDLANIIGTTKESLSRSLKYFKKESLIETIKRTIFIKNQDALMSMVE